ncbi:hypothetical protein BC937DRAFT_90714 [Endogone sp. FLAS-F59071]|nr:hypothetical protein BC937DRAFT_90714 [Endogone sp. FLAS-F59071]|eukprot:RUS21994.1 hypothetical protein BC937DRAFT_90714 [Endogone sp. FLAS-F59071]
MALSRWDKLQSGTCSNSLPDRDFDLAAGLRRGSRQTTITDACEHIATQCLRCLISELVRQHSTANLSGVGAFGEVGLGGIILSFSKSPKTADRLGVLRGTFNWRAIRISMEGLQEPSNAQESVGKDGQCRTQQAEAYLSRHYFRLTIYSLENYGIGPGSCIQFIVILYSINPTIQNITLYLDWIFPISGKDFLDGTCLVYRENSEVLVYDYQHQYRPPFPYVEHSGDKMNNNGRHEISVDIENLPQDVLQLYFVLSSYGSPTIKHFRNPSFQMFDKTRPDELLCQYRIADAGNSQAVVLACVSRCDQGWQATAIGRLSSGNVDDYEPIMCTIDALRHLV